MVKLMRGAVFSGAVVFVWGMLSWMVLPWHQAQMKIVGNPVQVTEMLVPNLTQKGIYTLPAAGDHSETAMRQLSAGPFVFIAMSPDGVDAMPVSMLRGFCIQVLAGFLVTFLLLRSGIATYRGRLFFVFVFALTAGLVTYLPEWNWWGFPSSYTLLNLADLVIGWTLAGLFLAGITGEKKAD